MKTMWNQGISFHDCHHDCNVYDHRHEHLIDNDDPYQGGFGGEEEGGTYNAFWSKPQDGRH